MNDAIAVTNCCIDSPISFACTLASAFSQAGQMKRHNVEFAKNYLMHLDRRVEFEQVRSKLNLKLRHATQEELDQKVLQNQQDRARRRLIKLMDIVFTKLMQKKMLVDERKHNIYRLVNCMTKYNQKWSPYAYAFFSFFFQVSAACYLVLSLTPLDKDPFIETSVLPRNLPLAIGTAGFGIMVAYPEMKNAGAMFEIHYGKDFSLLAFMDFFVNFVLTIVVTVVGFLVVRTLKTRPTTATTRDEFSYVSFYFFLSTVGASRSNLSGRCPECGCSPFHHRDR